MWSQKKKEKKKVFQLREASFYSFWHMKKSQQHEETFQSTAEQYRCD